MDVWMDDRLMTMVIDRQTDSYGFPLLHNELKLQAIPLLRTQRCRSEAEGWCGRALPRFLQGQNQGHDWMGFSSGNPQVEATWALLPRAACPVTAVQRQGGDPGGRPSSKAFSPTHPQRACKALLSRVA